MVKYFLAAHPALLHCDHEIFLIDRLGHRHFDYFALGDLIENIGRSASEKIILAGKIMLLCLP